MEGITIVNGTAPPEGWSGKLWALEQGLAHVHTPLILLLDADIELKAGMLAALAGKLRRERLAMVSLMAAPNMVRVWEKALMPAFVYFFKLVYPFSLSNRPGSGVAAAAGGCVLLETRMLPETGGFAAIRSAIIDDCTLAARIKSLDRPIWIGLTHAAMSRRSSSLADLGNMVARTAFTQLHYSLMLLIGCTVAFVTIFGLPVAGLFLPGRAFFLSLAIVVAMSTSYLPILRFYARSPLWVLALPLIAGWYLAMTWLSAFRYWHGERSRWKGRSYMRPDSGRVV